VLHFGLCHDFIYPPKSEPRGETYLKLRGQIPSLQWCQDKGTSTHQRQLWLVSPHVQPDALERSGSLKKVFTTNNTRSDADAELCCLSSDIYLTKGWLHHPLPKTPLLAALNTPPQGTGASPHLPRVAPCRPSSPPPALRSHLCVPAPGAALTHPPSSDFPRCSLTNILWPRDETRRCAKA